MPMFKNATDFTINNATFIDGSHTTDAMVLLRQHVALNAIHDSDERYDPPKCLPDTRTAILEMIERWAEGTGEPILWLTGPAGTGKSAIAQTICERLKEKGLLGPSFFFSRTAAGRNNREHVVPTLVYQLAMLSPTIQFYVERAIARDPLIFEKSLADQFRYLLIVPLEAAFAQGGRSSTTVIVIDGLDECSLPYRTQSYEDQQKQILELVAFTTQQHSSIRFLIASRPERQIRESFASAVLEQATFQLVLDGNSQSLADIGRFLDVSFADIRRKNPSIDPSWPSPESLNQLIRKSSGYFVYPSIVIRHLSSPRVNPEEALEHILNLVAFKLQDSRPLAELDALYKYVLDSVDQQSHVNALSILHFLVHENVGFVGAGSPVGYVTRSARQFLWPESLGSLWARSLQVEFGSPAYFAKLFSTTCSQVYIDLVDLHSVLNIPQSSAASSESIRIIHASFSEFLADYSRSGIYWVGGCLALPTQIQLLDHLHTKPLWDSPILAMSLIVFTINHQLYLVNTASTLGARTTAIFGLNPMPSVRILLMSSLSEIRSSPLKWWHQSTSRNLKLVMTSAVMVKQSFTSLDENLEFLTPPGVMGLVVGLIYVELLHMRAVFALRVSISAVQYIVHFVASCLPDSFLRYVLLNFGHAGLDVMSAMLLHSYILPFLVFVIARPPNLFIRLLELRGRSTPD